MRVAVILDPEGRQGTYENALRVIIPIPGGDGDRIVIDDENGELRVTHHYNTPNAENVSGEIVWSSLHE
jgi:hypothetical protein